MIHLRTFQCPNQFHSVFQSTLSLLYLERLKDFLPFNVDATFAREIFHMLKERHFPLGSKAIVLFDRGIQVKYGQHKKKITFQFSFEVWNQNNNLLWPQSSSQSSICQFKGTITPVSILLSFVLSFLF